MRFGFAGSPQLGAWVLADLVARGRVPALVVSQPDRPAGRGRLPVSPPVVVEARKLGLPTHQTENINSPGSIAALREAGVRTLLVAAFGQLLRKELLDEFLCLNVHASLLPAYRGAAPIFRALLDGLEETGVTIMRMAPGLDDGPWTETRRLSVGTREDAGSLSRALALLGALALDEVLTGLADGNVIWREQEGEPSYAHKVTPADRRLNPKEPVGRCHDRVRALSPDIGCETETQGGLRLKIWRSWPWPAEPTAARSDPVEAGLPPSGLREPGRLVIQGERLFTACSDGLLELLLIQPAGKRPLAAPELLRGYRRRLGDSLVTPTPAEKED